MDKLEIGDFPTRGHVPVTIELSTHNEMPKDKEKVLDFSKIDMTKPLAVKVMPKDIVEETLLQRCQRLNGEKAKKWLEGRVEENYAYIGNTDDLTSVCIDGWLNLDELLKLTIANTLKQAAEALEGMKTEEPLYVGKTQYEFYEGNIRWVANQALTDAQKVLGVDLSE